MRAAQPPSFLATLGMTALLLACHHESVELPPVTAPPPCELVSAAEIATIAGFEWKPGVTGGDETTVHRCTFEQAGETAAGSINVQIHVKDVDVLLSQLRNVPGNERITGLGDEAWWSNAVDQLTIRADRRLVTIGFNFGSAIENKQKAIDIANIVLPKL